MAAAAYSQLSAQWQDAGFIGRVQVAILQVAATKLLPGPAENCPRQAAAEDSLARQIIMSPAGWAPRFAFQVAVQLIGKSTLLDTTVTTDGDVFSAASLVYDDFLPQL